MLPDNAQAPQSVQVDLMAIDALFKRIAERGRKVRIQAKENFAPAQSTAHPTGQTVDGETKMTKAQDGK
jgi:hypothetical protein